MPGSHQHATLVRNRSRTQHPQMTAVQATNFTAASASSYATMLEALEERKDNDPAFADCTCEPYRDVYTFGRWQAQGLHVKAGQHAMRHGCWIETESSKAKGEAAQEGEQYKPTLRPWTSHVFCRCQVQ